MRGFRVMALAVVLVLGVASAQSNVTPRGVATNGVEMSEDGCEQTVLLPDPSRGSGLLAVVLDIKFDRPDVVSLQTAVRYAQPLIGVAPFLNVQMPEAVAQLLEPDDVYQSLTLGGEARIYKFVSTVHQQNQNAEFFEIELPVADVQEFLAQGSVDSRLSAGRLYAELTYTEPFITELQLGFGAECLNR